MILPFILSFLLLLERCEAFSVTRHSFPRPNVSGFYATPTTEVLATSTSPYAQNVLDRMAKLRKEAEQYAESFGLSAPEAGIYALFSAIRSECKLGLHGTPFVLRREEIEQVMSTEWAGFFTMTDLEKAVLDDFLDAARGSTDANKGWKISGVSNPRGDSFEEARMTFSDVQAALEKGTVIMNAAGAHIPKLAGPSLACTDATSLPCAINLYVTAQSKPVSAPPHTDKQDVVVVQTAGRKRWRVYAPPDPSKKPLADIFARGKNDDMMPLYALEKDTELLIETITNPGDILFMPAAFPHTTSTLDETVTETSVHLTFGIDHHIWELDYLSARRLALRRAGVVDNVLGQAKDGENPYTGKVNELPEAILKDLLSELPLGLLDDDEKSAPLISKATTELERISREVDESTANAVDSTIWKETIDRVRQQGSELLEIHRDMYLAAIDEGRTRDAEEAMTAHLESSHRRVMTPERMQRLSLFRVKRYFDKVNESKQALKEWSFSGHASGSKDGSAPVLPDDWAFTMPVKVGQQVEADLGGAFFAARVIRATGGTYDVEFFDGDRETGLSRRQIKLMSPSDMVSESDVDLSGMTPKQRKRWKKQQEKLS